VSADGVDWTLLRTVSRSFYLTLRLLPSAVREPIALAYLLARLTDTEADGAATAAERELLARREEFLAALDRAPDRDLIATVWLTIREGQEFDRQRFAPGAAPLSPAELDRYTFLVAGCVGDFWTKICARRLPGFSRDPEATMTVRGVAYGQGLQLVNILRDRVADHKLGRIYVPNERVTATLSLARDRLNEAAAYVRALRSRRLRAATALPLLLARETLDLIEAHPDADRVKVPRHRVWLLLGRALIFG
jgi:farnesyl-diphosphate farnesyltransferase